MLVYLGSIPTCDYNCDYDNVQVQLINILTFVCTSVTSKFCFSFTCPDGQVEILRKQSFLK